MFMRDANKYSEITSNGTPYYNFRLKIYGDHLRERQ